ncbi:MAG: HipA domain-containing protein [Chlamydiia bacterium]|nr:HipA domain-containing protein [Chlamydiia bacterium]
MEEHCFCCLLALGKESAHGLHQRCFRNWFGVDGLHAPFRLTMKTAGNSNDPKAELNSSFFHGKFRKYSAKLGESSYIIKVRQSSFPDLPAMEFLCNQIAKKLGINIPDFYLIRLEGEPAFVSKNFMEQYPGANLVHLYRFLGEQPFDLKTILQVISDHTGKSADIEQFIKLCLFDVFIGNHDRHGRNLALIQTAQGKMLSPIYDNPSCLGIEEEGFLKAVLEPCGKIHSSRSKEPKMREYALDFCEMGYEELVVQVYLSIALQEIVDLVSASFISPTRKMAFSKLLTRRYQELKEVADADSDR